MGSGVERGARLSGVLGNACCDGDRFAPIVPIASDSREEEDDRGVNGLVGGDGL
jgi:hypothetical protein